jgi:hypothetical protein
MVITRHLPDFVDKGLAFCRFCGPLGAEIVPSSCLLFSFRISSVKFIAPMLNEQGMQSPARQLNN